MQQAAAAVGRRKKRKAAVLAAAGRDAIEQKAGPGSSSSPAIVQVGSYRLSLRSRLLPLPDSTALYARGDWSGLFSRLDASGLLFVRGVIAKETVLAARRRVLQQLTAKQALEPDTAEHGELRALIRHAAGGERVQGWTVDTDSGGVNGDREDDSAVAGWQAVGRSAELRAVYDGPQLHHFYSQLFSAARAASQPQSPSAGRPPASSAFTSFPDCTWLRIRGHGDGTAEHTDYYFFRQERDIFSSHWPLPAQPAPAACTVCGDGSDPELTLLCDLCDAPCHTYCHSPPLPASPLPAGEYHCNGCAELPFPFYTCWIALGCVQQQHGRLALVEGSHRLRGYGARAKGDGKLPREWTARRAAAAVWRSSDMEPGDLVLFNVKTIHAASRNDSDEFRISVDTRVTFAQGAADRRSRTAAAEQQSRTQRLQH